MNDSELTRKIQDEVKRQINVILSGSAGANTAESETIDNMYPGMPSIENRPVMHPYGFASRAPNGTISVVARQGEHMGNRLVLGHRAADRPVLDEGEAATYSIAGYMVKVGKTSITVSKGGVTETAVCGDQLVTVLSNLLDAIIAHTHAGPGAPPTNISQFTSIKTSQVASGKILAKDGGRF